MALRMTREVLAAVAAHARETAPAECCGILLREGGPEGAVTAVLRAENAAFDRPADRYRIDHQTQLSALDLEIEGRAEIVGYYHSHPAGPPQPSPTDIAEAVPETLYLLCGLASGEPEFGAWRFEGGRAVPIAIETAGCWAGARTEL